MPPDANCFDRDQGTTSTGTRPTGAGNRSPDTPKLTSTSPGISKDSSAWRTDVPFSFQRFCFSPRSPVVSGLVVNSPVVRGQSSRSLAVPFQLSEFQLFPRTPCRSLESAISIHPRSNRRPRPRPHTLAAAKPGEGGSAPRIPALDLGPWTSPAPFPLSAFQRFRVSAFPRPCLQPFLP